MRCQYTCMDVNKMKFEKLGKVADIISVMVYCFFLLGEVGFIIRYSDGTINSDQLLLYTVCIVVIAEILYRDQKGRKKNVNDEVVKNNE